MASASLDLLRLSLPSFAELLSLQKKQKSLHCTLDVSALIQLLKSTNSSTRTSLIWVTYHHVHYAGVSRRGTVCSL